MSVEVTGSRDWYRKPFAEALAWLTARPVRLGGKTYRVVRLANGKYRLEEQKEVAQ